MFEFPNTEAIHERMKHRTGQLRIDAIEREMLTQRISQLSADIKILGWFALINSAVLLGACLLFVAKG